MIAKKDKKQIKKKKIPLKNIQKQVENLQKDDFFTTLLAPATIKNGIQKLNKSEQKEFMCFFEKEEKNNRCVYFIPSSGAASRMFALFHLFFNAKKITKIVDKENKKELEFLQNSLKKLPFYTLVNNLLKKDSPHSKEDYFLLFVKTFLKNPTFNFANLPKALVPFHKYSNEKIRTSFEEYIHFSLSFFKTEFDLHFTIDKEYLLLFQKKEHQIRQSIKEKDNKRLKITYSYQKPKTDTLSIICETNTILRDENKDIIFRKGGHGSLLENLNKLNNNLIFIRNIDNISREENNTLLLYWQKIIGGLFLFHQKQIFSFLNQLKKDSPEKILKESISYIKKYFNPNFSEESNFTKVFDFLNRPIRICGMVENKGQTGGGPFWKKNDNGDKSLQIIEKNQINRADKQQLSIFKKSTHFNPVSIVCSVKNYKGKPFDLKNFIDPSTYFTSKKNYMGREIKILEHPGLWNGSMAFWNSIFIEIPLATFTPVKTISDLLNKNHVFNE